MFEMPAARYNNAYFEAFAVALLICWSPFKGLSYVCPFLCILWIVLRSNSGKTILRSILVFIGFSFITLVYYVFMPHFLIFNSLLAFVTYGSFFFPLVTPKNVNFDDADFRRVFALIRFFIIVQSIIGITQVLLYSAMKDSGLDLSAGDVVSGTIGLTDFIQYTPSFNNVIFAIQMSILVCFYLPYTLCQKTGIWVVLLGLSAIVFASVIHVLLAFIFSVVTIGTYFHFSGRLRFNKFLIILPLLVVFVLSAFYYLQPANFSLIDHYWKKIKTNDSPKTKITGIVMTSMTDEYSYMPFTGLGIGQFSSRASLIRSGRYLGDFHDPKQLPLISPKLTAPAEEYLLPLWKESTQEVFGGSVMAKPFYSVLSIFTELGAMGLAAIIGLVGYYIYRIKKMYHNTEDRLYKYLLLAAGTGVLFLITLGFFENYLELPQAILPGIILTKISYWSSSNKLNDWTS